MEQNLPFALTPACFLASVVPLKQLDGAKTTLMPRYRLPHEGKLMDQACFADVFMGWSLDGLGLQIHVHKPWEKSEYPQLQEGDSVELFFDTRDRKEGGLTRFCHHFFFVPKAVEGLLAAEISTFRDLDAHDLCDPNLLEVQPEMTTKDYRLKIWIPAGCLHGYDPASFNRLGFTYRINRFAGAPQTFAISEREAPFDKHPARWATLNLIGP